MRNESISNKTTTTSEAFAGCINITSNSGKIGKLYIEDSGEQENTQGTLVCVPGFGETRASYQFVVDTFISKGYRVIISDARGVGSSIKGFNDFSLECIASDMREVVNQRRLADVILVGFSLTVGSVITLASESIPSVIGILLLDPELRNIGNTNKIDTASISMSAAGSSGKPVWHIYSNSPRKSSSSSTKSKTSFKNSRALPSFGKFFKSSKQRVEMVLLKSISLF